MRWLWCLHLRDVPRLWLGVGMLVTVRHGSCHVGPQTMDTLRTANAEAIRYCILWLECRLASREVGREVFWIGAFKGAADASVVIKPRKAWNDRVRVTWAPRTKRAQGSRLCGDATLDALFSRQWRARELAVDVDMGLQRPGEPREASK